MLSYFWELISSICFCLGSKPRNVNHHVISELTEDEKKHLRELVVRKLEERSSFCC